MDAQLQSCTQLAAAPEGYAAESNKIKRVGVAVWRWWWWWCTLYSGLLRRARWPLQTPGDCLLSHAFVAFNRIWHYLVPPQCAHLRCTPLRSPCSSWFPPSPNVRASRRGSPQNHRTRGGARKSGREIAGSHRSTSQQ